MMKPLSILVLFVLLLIACGEKSEAISITDTYGTVSTPSLDLLTAIDKKNLNLIKQQIAAGTNINDYAVPQGQPWEGAQPMHIAVLKNNAEIIKILLENGANINIKAKNKEKRIINKITMAEDTKTSLLPAHVTFCNSCLTCLTKSAGDVFFFSIFIFSL